MNYDEYKNRMAREIELLTNREKVAICLICCVRLFPLYKSFSESENWGSSPILCETQDAAKKWLRGEGVKTRLLAQKLSAVVPDMDDFGSLQSSFALNAGLAHEHLLEQTESNDNEPAFYALLSCYDTIDFYVQELLDPECKGSVSEKEIENHPVMRKEIKLQLSLFCDIKDSNELGLFVDKCGLHAIIDPA